MAAACLAVLGLAGCGVPSSSEPRVIASVPHDLLSPGTAAPTRPSAPAGAGPRAYLVVGDDRLTPVEADPTGEDTASAVRGVLARLGSGPTDTERTAGLSTALGPEVTLALAQVSGGRAEVDVGGAQVASPERLPLAVGQVVLSVTSVPGVSSVVLRQDGEPIEAPLPGGARTALPLTAADYSGLVARRG
jgi:hypothetical protein